MSLTFYRISEGRNQGKSYKLASALGAGSRLFNVTFPIIELKFIVGSNCPIFLTVLNRTVCFSFPMFSSIYSLFQRPTSMFNFSYKVFFHCLWEEHQILIRKSLQIMKNPSNFSQEDGYKPSNTCRIILPDLRHNHNKTWQHPKYYNGMKNGRENLRSAISIPIYKWLFLVFVFFPFNILFLS